MTISAAKMVGSSNPRSILAIREAKKVGHQIYRSILTISEAKMWVTQIYRSTLTIREAKKVGYPDSRRISTKSFLFSCTAPCKRFPN